MGVFLKGPIGSIAGARARMLAAQRGPLARTVVVPAPSLGLNTTDDPSAMDPRYATALTNLLSGKAGVSVVTGNQIHIDDAQSVILGTPRSLLAFHGAASADNRLFSVDISGIYNVTRNLGVGVGFSSSSSACVLEGAEVQFIPGGAT